jgi:hypothetical protein
MRIRARSAQPGHDGLIEAVLGGQHDDVPGRNAVAAVGPHAAGRGRGYHRAMDLRLAAARDSSEQFLGAAREVAVPQPIHRPGDDVGGAHQHVAGRRVELVEPIGDVTAFAQFRKLDAHDLRHNRGERADLGLAEQPAGRVVILQHVHQLLALEVPVQLRPPLRFCRILAPRRAAGIAGCDQAERGEALTIFFAFGHEHRHLGQCGEQFR